MKRPHQITAICCLLVAAYVARDALVLKYATPLGPGPGFFPLWLAGLFAALAAVMLWQATAAAAPAPARFFADLPANLRIGTIVAALVATAVLMVPLGFRLTLLAFNLVLIGVLGRRGRIETILVSVAGSFGVYQVFVNFLRIPLPVGVFGI